MLGPAHRASLRSWCNIRARSRCFPWPFDTRPAAGDGHSPESSLRIIFGTTDLVVDGVRKTFLRNKANLEQPLSHLEDTPHVKCEHEAKAAAGMGDSTEFDSSVEKCREVSKSVEFRGVGEGSSRAVGVAPITFICNGIDRGSGSRQGARKRALQAKTGVSCRNVECEAAAAGRARDEK